MLRFLYFYFFESGAGKIQSLIIGSSLLTIGTLTFVLGLVADLLNHNRQLTELTLEKVRWLELRLQDQTWSAQTHPAASPDLPNATPVSLADKRRARRTPFSGK
jgi:hypothetical protein